MCVHISCVWQKYKWDSHNLEKPTGDYLWNDPGCVLSGDSAKHWINLTKKILFFFVFKAKQLVLHASHIKITERGSFQYRL